MRKLLLLSGVIVVGLTAPASAQEPPGPVVAAEFAESFPTLLPMEETGKTGATASGALGPDERVLVAATYWLLLGGLALRRVRCRVESDWMPVAGWVIGDGPPLPR